MLRVKLFGKATVLKSNDSGANRLPKKAFLVLALVAKAPGQVRSRTELAQLLWPDRPIDQQANNLRQLLYRVRQFEVAGAHPLLDCDDYDVRLRSEIPCDVLQLERASAGETKLSIEDLLQTYTGRLLEDLRVEEKQLGQWLGDQRLQLEDQFVDLLLATVEHLSSDLRSEALTAGTRVAPGSIGIRKALMRQLILDGATQEARRQYRAITHIGGHGVLAAPAELVEVRGRGPLPAAVPALPLGQVGKDLAGVPRLALLPPRGAASSPGDLLTAECLIDDVTIALTRLRSISVVAPHTARRVANGEDPLGAVLARVDFVLRTKLTTRNTNAKPHLSLLLERTASGDVVWAEGMDLDPETGPRQFAAVANGVALTLVDRIERATLRAFQIPAEAGAYGHYLVGQKALEVLDLPSTRRARTSFRSALAISPNFVPAHTGHAQSLIYEWVMRGRDDKDLLARARTAAQRALDIDPLFGSAHQMIGRASLFEGAFDASLQNFERAESLNPHHADMLCDFADTLMHSSLASRANDKIELALNLNPLAPDAYWWASAGIKFFVGEFDGALTHLSKIKNSEPVLRLTAACAAMAERPELAKSARERFLAIDPGFVLDEWIQVLPLRDPSHRRQYRNALQKAGFK